MTDAKTSRSTVYTSSRIDSTQRASAASGMRLYSVDHAPVQLPSWQQLLDELGQPSARRLARVLGVGARTVYRWNASGHAPRVACLALFWLTRWGRSAIDAQAVNDARTAVAYADGLRRELLHAERQIAHLRAIGRFDTANEPLAQPRHAPR